MKRTIILTALIVLAAFWLGRHLDARIAAERSTAAKLAAEAGKAGISHATRERPARRPGEAERNAEAHRLAKAWLNDPKARKPIVVPSHEQLTETEQRIRNLDAGQLKTLFEDLLTELENDPSIIAERIADMLRQFARRRPREALDLIDRHPDTLHQTGVLPDIIRESLGAWADFDGPGAVSWLADHWEDLPESSRTTSVFSVFGPIAKQSPRMALQISEALPLDESATHDLLHSVISAAHTNEARTAALAALRECRAGKLGGELAAGLVSSRLGDVGQELQREPFAEASRWLEDAGLDEEEWNRICSGLVSNYGNQGGKEFPAWIEWMGRQLPARAGPDASGPLACMMERWTERDYEAAGHWLVEAQDGPAKVAAVAGYVRAISPYDLDTALQWIESLPDERDRMGLLRSIHWNLPKKTDEEKAAAAEFAAEHGIKK